MQGRRLPARIRALRPVDAHCKFSLTISGQNLIYFPSKDATNVMITRGDEFEYLREGMAGRPTRTLIEFIAQTICKDTAPKMGK